MSELLCDIEPVRPLLARTPFAILSDIDGTLAPIVPNPADASISPRAHEALAALMERGVQVGLITGRALERAQEMARLPDAMYATNHGLNIAAGHGVESPEALQEWADKAQALLPALANLERAGVSVEDKGPIIALHYRRAPSENEAKAAIRGAAEVALTQGFHLQEGRMVVELRPPIDVNKGTAALELARRMKARAILAMGDDLTDVDLFDAVRSLRPDVESVVVAVTSAETPDAVMAAADYSVDGVEGVERLLEEVLRSLPGSAR